MKFLQIRSDQFPVLPGEKEETFNPGTFGKAFAQYLESALQNKGYETDTLCAEDWGWWLGVKLPSKSIGLCCYREHDENKLCNFACGTSPAKTRFFSLKKFGYIDIKEELDQLIADLKATFEEDPEVEYIGTSDEFPLW